MAKVHYAPYEAVKYVGNKAKEFQHSTARPRPTLKKGDFAIVDRRTAFTLVEKGFGEFERADEIAFVKADQKANEKIEELQARISELESDDTLQKYKQLLQDHKKALAEVEELRAMVDHESDTQYDPGQDEEHKEKEQ